MILHLQDGGSPSFLTGIFDFRTLTDATVVIKAFLAEEDVMGRLPPCGCHGNVNHIWVYACVSYSIKVHPETTNMFCLFLQYL